MNNQGIHTGAKACVFRRTFTFIITFIAVFATQMMPAAATDMFKNDSLPIQLSNAYKAVMFVALGLAAIALVICGIQIFVCGEKGMEFCRKWGVKLGLSIIMLVLIPNILVAGYNTFKSAGWSPTNPTQNSPVSFTDESTGYANVFPDDSGGEGTEAGEEEASD